MRPGIPIHESIDGGVYGPVGRGSVRAVRATAVDGVGPPQAHGSPGGSVERMKEEGRRLNEEGTAQLRRSADVPVCCIAGFLTCALRELPTRHSWSRRADSEIGGTAGWETCATVLPPPGQANVMCLPPPSVERMKEEGRMKKVPPIPQLSHEHLPRSSRLGNSLEAIPEQERTRPGIVNRPLGGICGGVPRPDFRKFTGTPLVHSQSRCMMER